MSAAVSEPTVVFSAPFLGSLTLFSTRSLSLRATSRRLGGTIAPVKRFFRRIDLGVPRYDGSGGDGRSSGPEVAWRFRALPASKASSSDARGWLGDGEGRGVVGVVEGLVDVLATFCEPLFLACRAFGGPCLSGGSGGVGTVGPVDI